MFFIIQMYFQQNFILNQVIHHHNHIMHFLVLNTYTFKIHLIIIFHILNLHQMIQNLFINQVIIFLDYLYVNLIYFIIFIMLIFHTNLNAFSLILNLIMFQMLIILILYIMEHLY